MRQYMPIVVIYALLERDGGAPDFFLCAHATVHRFLVLFPNCIG